MKNNNEYNSSADQTQTRKTGVLEVFTYLLATIAVLVGIASVLEVEKFETAHESALYWFAFALIAVLVPYIHEITFKDLKIVVDKISSASETLKGAAISVENLNIRLNDTRAELINGYQEMLNSLPKDERKKRVLKLSNLYLREMGTSVNTIKKWLLKAEYKISKIDNNMDDEYLDALKRFQRNNNLVDDGIFGYQTMNLLSQWDSH